MYRRTRRAIYSAIIVGIVALLSLMLVPVTLAAPLAQELPEVNLAHFALTLGLLGTMSWVIESVVELLNVWIIKSIVSNEEQRAGILKLLAAAIGIVFTVSYGIDLFAVVVAAYSEILDLTPMYPMVASWAGMVITGFATGRGSQWFHDAGQKRIGLDGA